MLHQVVEELEAILNQTNILKQRLNVICEKSWDCLCPPGKGGHGHFVPIKHTNNKSENKGICDATKSPLEDLLGNVSDLIAYGKNVRESAFVENVKKEEQSPFYTVKNCVNQSNKLMNANVQQQLSRGGNKTNKNVNSKFKKSLQPNANQVGDAKLNTLENSKKKDLANESSDCKFVSKSESSNKLQTPKKYQHSCSLTITEIAKSIKIPTNILLLLTLYNQYESLKIRKDQHKVNFHEKFYSHVKSRLTTDIKRHLKEEEKFLKYLEIADSVYKSHKDNILLSDLHNRTVLYESVEQLYLLEDKYQRLLELQFQRRLMNVVINT